MADDSQELGRLFERLPELEKVELLRAAGIRDDRPSILRGRGGRPAEGYEWVQRHRTLIAPLILRAVDPTDDEIAALVAAGDLVIGELDRERAIQVRFTVDTQSRETQRASLSITDVAATSAALAELFVNFAAAHRPFGDEVLPPDVSVERGSVEYKIGGGLFATGMGIIVGCSAGLVAAPVVGPIVGTSLAVVGIIDLALGWRKKIAEIRKLDEERSNLEPERRIKEIDFQIKELELEKARASIADVTESRSRVPYSSLIPREVVQNHAIAMGISEGYANHILNRTLPSFQQVRSHMVGWTITTEEVNP